MAYFKEIVTKAVVGKGKKATTGKYSIKPEETPNTVLGCWIINHRFNGSLVNGEIYVNGNYDVNVWYSYDNDSKTGVCSGNYSYSDKMKVPVNVGTKLTNNSEVIVNSLSDPNVVDVDIMNGTISFTVRKEMGVEVVGDTKIRVNVEDNFEDYMEIVDEDVTYEIFEEIVSQVKENYINESEVIDSTNDEA